MPRTVIRVHKRGKFDFNGKTTRVRQTAASGMRQMIEDIHSTSRPVTPMKTGALRGDVRKRVFKRGSDVIVGTIEWARHYAWYQERGYGNGGEFKNYTTAGTGAHFAENSVKTVTSGNTRKYFGRKI